MSRTQGTSALKMADRGLAPPVALTVLPALLALIAFFAASPSALAAESSAAGGGGPGKVPAEKARPLCRADITPVEGLPSRGLFLMSFEDGVYRVRTDRDEFEVPEEEIRSITFHPLKKKRKPDRRRRGPPEGERAGRPGFLREVMRRQIESRKKLAKLERSGKLGLYIAERKDLLALVDTVELATKILIDLSVANRVIWTPLDREDWGALLRSIEDPVVRERAISRQKSLQQLLNRPRPGPRGRRFGPGGR